MGLKEARRAFVEAEKDRFDPVFWDEERWRLLFIQLCTLETRIEHNMRKQRDAARTPHEIIDQDRSQERFCQECIEWYSEQHKQLKQRYQRLLRTAGTDDYVKNRLYTHVCIIELRLHKLLVHRHQLRLDHLEIRRRYLRSFHSSAWLREWADLEKSRESYATCYSAHQAFFTRHDSLLDMVHIDQLEWAEQLRIYQAATSHYWQHTHKKGDGHSLNQHAKKVATYIKKAQPCKVFGFWAKTIASLVIGMIAVLLVAQRSNSEYVPLATPTPQPLPTAVPYDQSTLNQLGMQKMQEGDCRSAILLFQKGFEAAPDSAQAYELLNNQAFCYYELGANQDAKIRWEDALHRNQKSPDAHAGYALALQAAGDEATAQAEYKYAITLNSGYSNETWMRIERLWSQKALDDSRLWRP